jgi:hypothetical protein
MWAEGSICRNGGRGPSQRPPKAARRGSLDPARDLRISRSEATLATLSLRPDSPQVFAVAFSGATRPRRSAARLGTRTWETLTDGRRGLQASRTPPRANSRVRARLLLRGTFIGQW